MLYQWIILGVLLLIGGMAWRNLREFRRPSELAEPETTNLPLVSVLVPARNEEANIEACLRGLLAQDYRRLEITVLDDGSTDATGPIIDRLASEDGRLRRVIGTGLPPGWGGKTHACWEAAAHAGGDWLLFVDADTRHQPGFVSGTVRAALATDADFLSGFPRQQIGTLGEALTVPLMYWVFFTLLPHRQAQHGPQPAMIAACGQCYLVRRETYAASGGHEAIAPSLHDGLHLARRVKACGGKVRLVDLSGLITCRMYRGWVECWNGFTRNAYQAFGNVPVALFVMVLEAVLFLGPFLSLAGAMATGWPIWGWFALAQVGLILVLQLCLRSRFHYPFATVALFPVAISGLILIQACSMLRSLTGRPTRWKDRSTETPTSLKRVDAQSGA